MRSFLASMTRATAAVALVILSAAGLAAQSSTGNMRGTVKDAQGVIPGATVAIVNDANGTTRETVSNESGEYSFPALDPGTYSVRVAVPGFRTFERKSVRVNTQANVGLDVTLEVGSLEETITVTADAPLIETTNASTGGVVDAKTLESIPTAGRSVFLMATLEPTVQSSENAHWNRMQDQQGNSGLSMGGGAVRANNFLVDGFPVTDLTNRASTNPTMEAVGEMKVQVHTYDAEMGRTGGGVMNMTAKSGSNQWRGSAYTVIRPETWAQQLLIPALQHQPNLREQWKNGGGGGGGPLIKNKTFFWFAGEKYIDNQPQQNSFLVPTQAELRGDFSQTTRNGALQVIKDPLTGVAFPGNVIPANRLNAVGAKLASYFPKADTEVDNGSSNFSLTDLLPNKAYQITTKLDHHFNEKIALNGFMLRQVSHEANSNYNPTNKFVGGSYQLDRTIKTFVVNNTYVINSSTVLTLRGGYNKFDDNYNLPYEFDAKALFNNPTLTNQMSDTNRFPTTAITGYKGSGWTAKQTNGYYQYGTNGTLSKLTGRHSFKFGGDYRVLGVKSLNYGASTGSYTFTGTYSNNALADLLLGYPQSGNIPLNAQLNGFVNYAAGYAQDDWRINDRLTINYGVRLEHETGLAERNNNITVNFDQASTSPLNNSVNVIDPVTGARRTILGGLVFAGQNGANTEQGNQPKLKVAPRVGVVYSLNEKTVLRSGWGLYYAPWVYPAAGTNSWGQYGYAATTDVPQSTGSVPTVSMSNPFPAGLVQPSGSSLGALTGVGGTIQFVDPSKGAPKVQQYSADLQRELPLGMSLTLNYTGSTGTDLGWGGTANTLININQLDPKYQALGPGYTTVQVANPFFGVAGAGQFAGQATIARGQLLRPFPQFGDINMMQSTGAHSQYHAGIIQVRKRNVGLWGANVSYTYSRLSDNQFGQGNYYSAAPGLQNNYEVIPGSSYYNPDQEYGLSLLNAPHKVVIAPTLNLPFGKGHNLAQGGIADALVGGWSVTTVVTFQSGFPIGVSQNVTGTQYLFGGTLRPNVVDGQDFLVSGDITERIRGNTTDNLYLNKAAFSATALNAFGNAPRILPGVSSPWRNNVDLSVSKNLKTGGQTNASFRLEVLNLFNQVQWAGLGTNGTAFGNSVFGQITNQANNMRMVQATVRFQF
ncbi:MAG: carboxypeptidase regulatory-like domain-containing protein [Vicinamibacterales bacterium]